MKLGTYRRYKHKFGGPNILIAWMNRHCTLCGRFLPKENKKYCSRCSQKHVRKYNNRLHKEMYRNNKEFREEKKLRAIIRKYPDRFKVGDIV
jgi:hypothetical protein